MDIDFEADGERRGRIDRGNDLVHAQDIRPELLVAVRVEAKNVLTLEQRIALPIAGNERPTALDNEAAKLNPGNGYQLLLHKAWSQSIGSSPSRVAVSSGEAQFGHHPVEGTLSFTQERFADLELELWINQFSADGLLDASEHLKIAQRLKDNSLTYLDHGSLGALIRISPL